MNNKVIYTSLVGDIDTLLQPNVIDPSFDYICFTDQENQSKIGVWSFRKIQASIKDSIRLSRFPKLLPHIVLPEYEYSLYIDANVVICDAEFYHRIDFHINQGDLICQLPHPTRDCIYLELEQCVNIRKITPYQYMKHRSKYRKMGLPFHFGLFENNIILRKHNTDLVINISERWWEEYNTISNRDQLSLMPVYFNVGYMPKLLLGMHENSRNSTLVKCVSHISKSNTQQKSFLDRIVNYFMRMAVLPFFRKIYTIPAYYSQW